MNSSIFSDKVPTVPQWSGPPHEIIQVQALLYASLSASLLSAFLAMLGKQWLNQYVSTNARGTAVERGQDRQRKFNGIITWYFEYVMESLPLMLQAALLLLGCALCRYLWGINTTIASVVIGVTSFGVLFYLFIVAAGAASKTCPYQTPASCFLHSVPSAITSAHHHVVRGLVTYRTASGIWRTARDRQFLQNYGYKIPPLSNLLLKGLADITILLGCVIVWPLVAFAHWTQTWLLGVLSTPVHASDQQTTSLDLQSISWMLNTSLDRADHLSALESLATMVLPSDLDPTIITNCFTILLGCVKVVNDVAAISQGSEQLAMVSATCLLQTYSHLSIVDPRSAVLKELCQCYNEAFPLRTSFNSLKFSHTFSVIHHMFHPDHYLHFVSWEDHRPSSYEHIISSCALTKLAQFLYQRREDFKQVPQWILHFVLHSLSLDPLPPTPVVIDCLSIIAISLDCDISSTIGTSSYQRFVST